MSDRAAPHRFRHQPLLGTVVELQLGGVDEATAEAVDAAVVAEIDRLERIFSVYDPRSELRRWQRAELDRPGPELTAVLRLALHWQHRSGGAFNPAAGAVVARWRAAEARGEPPSPAEMAAVAAAVAQPRYRIDADGVPRLDARAGAGADAEPAAAGDPGDRVGPADPARPSGPDDQDQPDDRGVLDLNAVAKGWIVDRAVAAGLAAAPAGADLLVSAGGDLCHRGPGSVAIGIENPLRPYDNEPPIVTVELADAGLATSGRARRGFRIAGRWYGHVVDPRTGATADHVAGITVVADDAVTADVLATILGLMTPEDAVAHAHNEGVACLVVAPDGSVAANDRWRALPGAAATPDRVRGSARPR